jgi:hypothetical protein
VFSTPQFYGDTRSLDLFCSPEAARGLVVQTDRADALAWVAQTVPIALAADITVHLSHVTKEVEP